MTEHLLALVQATADGETTLQLASEVTARGGRASVVLLVDAATRHDITAFAESESLSYNNAHTIAIDQLCTDYAQRVGGDTTVTAIHDSAAGRDQILSGTFSPDMTALAIPRSLAARRDWQRHLPRTRVTTIIPAA